jgi:hypothetical protein
MLQTIRLKTSVLRRSLLSVDHSSLHDVWLQRERESEREILRIIVITITIISLIQSTKQVNFISSIVDIRNKE